MESKFDYKEQVLILFRPRFFKNESSDDCKHPYHKHLSDSQYVVQTSCSPFFEFVPNRKTRQRQETGGWLWYVFDLTHHFVFMSNGKKYMKEVKLIYQKKKI